MLNETAVENSSNDLCAFADLGINSDICKALTKMKLSTPTPIQASAIPHLISGKDLIGIAATGTGKTFAFALPIIQKLSACNEQVLIMVPTRELAWQVEESFRSVLDTMGSRLGTVALIGGVPMERQRAKLKRNPKIIVATPGRLYDHLKRRTFNLSGSKTVVLDEADRMFDIGFAPQIKQILSMCPKDRQSMLFSATMPPEIKELAETYLQNPEKVEVSRAGESSRQVTQELCLIQQNDKAKMLESILANLSGQTLVFSKTKHGTKKLAHHLKNLGFDTAELHSDRSMSQRKQAMDGFKKGRYRILIATDIAARGIDVSDIELVINYDLPQSAEDYVHRIGRTGRAGKTGKAISFAGLDQIREVKRIEKVTSSKFELSEFSLPMPNNYDSGPRTRFSAGGNRRRSNNNRFRRNEGRRSQSW